MIIGTWFRMLVTINNNFYFVLIGHIIASISQAFIQNPVAKMAITWFGDKERGKATAFGSMSMPLGSLISFLLPNLFFKENQRMEYSELDFYILIQSFIVTTLTVPSLIFLKEEPLSPPTVLLRDKNAII